MISSDSAVPLQRELFRASQPEIELRRSLGFHSRRTTGFLEVTASTDSAARAPAVRSLTNGCSRSSTPTVIPKGCDLIVPKLTE